MLTLVDTSVWSLAFRRRRRDLSESQHEIVTTWENLVREKRARLIGPITQEVLSGIRDNAVFERLRLILTSYDYEDLIQSDYELAASCCNTCRAKGISGSPIDFLICAVSIRVGASVLTTDDDFHLYAKCLPIRLLLQAE